MFDCELPDAELPAENLRSVSSKFPSRRSKNEFYHYYAGYPLEFAEWALRKLQLTAGAQVIDPWHGSGTTAAACARVGASCQGYDISPVMVHLGRSRVASDIDFVEANELVESVQSILSNCHMLKLDEIGQAYQEIPVGNELAHSVAVAALFPYARELLNGRRTRNPSWFKKNTNLNDVTIKADFFILWRSLLQQLSRWRSNERDFDGVAIRVNRGDSRKSLGRRDAYDGALTSPPYLTRLDYVQATLPELAMLDFFESTPDVRRLRRSMIGSPLTSGRPDGSIDRLPSYVLGLLDKIASHPSKASETYYLRFFSTYFVDLHVSIKNLVKVLRDDARCCIVVQSSNYKEVEVDLAAALLAIGGECGLTHLSTIEFASRRSMSLVNVRAHADARRPKSERAIFLRKD